MSALALAIKAIINKQQRIPRQKNNQKFQHRENTPPPNKYFYCEDPHFISTKHYTPLKDNVTNQYIYIDNNLVFLGPRIPNTQKTPRRPDMTLRESIIKELRLRDR